MKLSKNFRLEHTARRCEQGQGAQKTRYKLKLWEISLITALCVTLLCGFVMDGSQRELSDKLIRLHVVANSDSGDDQALKLRVRDRVLEALEPVLEGAGSSGEAERRLRDNLELAGSAAEKELTDSGYDYGVTVSLRQEYFPTRDYDGFSLPAGEYTSLRVEIGEAAGHNWWCVVFPPLCTEAAVKEDMEAMGLTEDESALITEENGYVIKFRLIEIFEKLKGRIFS